MKLKLLCCLMVVLLALPVAARPPKGDNSVPSAAIIDNSTFIDVNRILMFVTNHGNFGRDLAGVFGYDYGTFYPYTGDTSLISGDVNQAGQKSPNYAAGLWVGGQVDGETRIIISEYSSEYVPGPMANGTFLPDNPDFRVYKLYRDSLAGNPNDDYLNWPVDQGAPVDGDGNPDMIGDQMLWAVYNDADPNGHTNDAGETDPLGIEVKQTVFGFDRLGSLGDMVFVRYRVYNKGGNTINNCYLSVWYDPDLGTSGDDLVGCDTTIDLGFCYNSTNNDGQYGDGPPALGCDFFQGPLRARTDADTTDDGEPIYGRMWGQIYEDSVNNGLSSFNKYINGTDPDNFDETYGFMRGLTKTGDPYVFEGDTLMFVHTGDPVTGTGDIDIAPDDRRWMQTTGPITFAPGDSTEILIAMIVGQGGNNLQSITVMKELDKFAQKLYEEGFNPPAAPAKPVVTVAALPNEITLSWGDTSEVDQGEFPFEGYSVWQGASSSGPWTLLQTWDVVNDRSDAETALMDTLFDLESGLYLPTVMRSVKNTGLAYSYRAVTDKLTNEPLRDLTEYYYRVSAFSFGFEKLNGDRVPNGDRFLESARDVTVIPASPVAGVHPTTESQEILAVNHVTGASDGVIEPVVVDPTALTGHEYRITFTDIVAAIDSVTDPDHPDTTWQRVWNVDDLTAGVRVLENQINQEDNETFRVFDGIKLRVMGPPAGFKEFQVVANADGPFDPPDAGAFWFGDFPVPTERDADGYITDIQQVYRNADGDFGQWGIHTADNGGSGAGSRGGFDAFLSRVLRDGGNNAALGGTDYEMRFTGTNDDPGVNGSYGIEWYNDDNVFWTPFELWQTGVATPDDPSDDLRLIFFIIDDYDDGVTGDNMYELESWGLDANGTCSGDCEHSVSGAGNDPFTDWVYWIRPVDETPGDAAYLAAEADMLAGTFADNVGTHYGSEIMARTVLVSWNGGEEPPFVQNCPEQGTVFRIITNKPNFPADTFTFTAPAPLMTATENDLDLIKAVPNPFYLSGGYDPNPGSYAIKFHHLPPECTITIYNLGGDLVRTIEKDDAASAEASWDVLTEAGLPVASGIYIYVVDAPGFGTKIGKMAVFVQKEVLDIY